VLITYRPARSMPALAIVRASDNCGSTIKGTLVGILP